jgi:hypothetical protein
MEYIRQLVGQIPKKKIRLFLVPYIRTFGSLVDFYFLKKKTYLTETA